MTKQELQHFKQHVSKALDIGSTESCIYTFLPEDIQEAGGFCLPFCLCYCRMMLLYKGSLQDDGRQGVQHNTTPFFPKSPFIATAKILADDSEHAT